MKNVGNANGDNWIEYERKMLSKTSKAKGPIQAG